MTKKEILRKTWTVLSYLYLFYITVKFLLGKADIFSMICMFICYFAISLNVISGIILKIVKVTKIVNCYRLYKTYKDGLEYLKAVHKERYKLYFTGSKEMVEEYSSEIERYGTILLNSIESVLSDHLLNKKYSQMVQEILEQTKNLINDEGLG